MDIYQGINVWFEYYGLKWKNVCRDPGGNTQSATAGEAPPGLDISRDLESYQH